MNKKEFLKELEVNLKGLPKLDIDERIAFYSEMIDDIIEDGETEENAVKKVGDVNKIAKDIFAEYSLIKIVKEKINPKRKLKAWEITLIAVSSPIWVSLIVAFFAVIVSLYAVAWAVVISLWATFIGSSVCAVVSVVACGVYLVMGSYVSVIAVIGLGLASLGLAILFLFDSKYATKGLIVYTKKFGVWLKVHLIKGGKDND